jgi:hypothetical protein
METGTIREALLAAARLLASGHRFTARARWWRALYVLATRCRRGGLVAPGRRATRALHGQQIAQLNNGQITLLSGWSDDPRRHYREKAKDTGFIAQNDLEVITCPEVRCLRGRQLGDDADGGLTG